MALRGTCKGKNPRDKMLLRQATHAGKHFSWESSQKALQESAKEYARGPEHIKETAKKNIHKQDSKGCVKKRY